MGRKSSGTLTASGYRALVREVKALVAEGHAQAESAVGHVLAVTYWKVGRRLERERLSTHAGYGTAMMAQLAAELQMEAKTLHRALAFSRLYDKPPEPGLSWVHYRELIALKDAAERRWYEKLALSEGWSGRKLTAEIKADGYGQAGAAVSARPKLARPREATHVYRGWVMRVVDGDTLLLHVDLGFEVIKEQRLRLARVNAAPATSAEGKAAIEHLLQALGGCEFVVVKTDKVDLHGRYVGHVFYPPRRGMTAAQVFAQGRYLNDELLRAGLVTLA